MRPHHSLFRLAPLCLPVLLALGSLARATAQDKAPRQPQWQEQAKEQELAPAEIERLRKDKFVIARKSFRQVFTPYLYGDVPAFITSDSLLNAFHVLFEESVMRLESANASRLPELLRFIWKELAAADRRLKGKPALAADATRRARAVIGTALELLGEKTPGADPALAALIKDEARRVTAPAGSHKPKWLGPPDKGFRALDYSRYKPRGFYTRSERLQRHFRAVSWLQSIPFRVEKDAELLAALLIGDCLRSREDKASGPPKGWDSLCRGYQLFLGTGDDWDLVTLAWHVPHKFPLDLEGKQFEEIRGTLREWVNRDGKGPKINDQLRFIPDNPTEIAEASFRLLSAYRVPDAVLFQRTTDPRTLKRAFPSGLEVCALLGSSFARDRLGSGKDGKKFLETIDRARGLLASPEPFSEPSLYAQYLRCLEALVGPPEPDAPAFLSGKSWRLKTCQTALAGWAQLRHTWALQAKQNVRYLGRSPEPTGFIEPVPEFYARLARLVENTKAALRERGALGSDWPGVAADLRAFLRLAAKHDLFRKGLEGLKDLPRDDQLVVGRFAELWLIGGSEKRLRKVADQLEKGVLPDDPGMAELVATLNMDLGWRWDSLERLCHRLETLAHKQLRGVAFNEREQDFVRGYGKELAAIMFYGGNSYFSPRDDAPRIVDVFSSKSAHLEVGIGRPRALYVLYPFGGKEVLCRGAVLPYYEFTHSTRLDDRAWKALLDSPNCPAPPDWLQPILPPAAPKRLKEKGDR
jgi:hypothetical protein